MYQNTDVLISEIDSSRIANDAWIAIDALTAVMNDGMRGQIHPDYLSEKVNCAQRCLNFMKNFCE